jgi:hypothetical protein
MAGVEDMIRMAERSLGTNGRPNAITRWYAGRNGNYFARAAWCDQSVTYWAHRSGNHVAVCFGKDYAYTVWHAQRFQKNGQWHVDIGGIRRGDIVFFDWGGSNRIGAIDHVGVVTDVKGGVVYTIEGNTSDRCRRRARYSASIVGYGRPNYTGRPSLVATAGPARAVDISDKAPTGSPVLKQGSTGSRVAQLQKCLNKVIASRLAIDSEYGPKTQAAVKSFQKKAGGLHIDGEYGPKTASQLAVFRNRLK